MNHILTIDFDIIMNPSIELYNDLIGDNKGIDKIIKQYPLLEYTLTADLFIYEALTREIIKLFKTLPYEKINFITDHQTLINCVKEYDVFTLYNIDHHHDIGYNRITPISKITRPENGNWVKWLKDNNKLNEYYWICNNNSSMPLGGLSKLYLTDSIEIKDFDFNSLKNIDKLIICNSPQWVPPNLQALFITWVGIAEEYYGEEFKIL